jgi:hypothetical protein
VSGASVFPDAAVASAAGPTPTLAITTTISPPAAIATGSGPTSTVDLQKTITVAAAANATATNTAPGWSLQTGVPGATASATGPTPALVAFTPAGAQPTIGGITASRVGRIAQPLEGAVT